MGRVTSRHKVVRLDLRGDEPVTKQVVDTVAAEEPLEIRVNGETFTVTMRTPGHDVELAHGLLLAEGVIKARDDVVSARFCTDLDSLNVLNFDVPSPGQAATSTRHLASFGGCGLCGTTAVDAVGEVVATPPPDVRREPGEVLAAMESLREAQPVFAKTGGVHAAGLARAGEPLLVREDVGRHNAVDKVLGAALVNGPTARGALLVVSSRAGFEIVQKAAVSGVAVLACVSAPSSLAIEAADRLGVTLAGFVRGQSMNLYTHPERLG